LRDLVWPQGNLTGFALPDRGHAYGLWS
jgi:hypothetical protein